MSEKLQTLKYTFTVEGETEQWYLNWLRDQINHCGMRTFNVVIDAKVQQSPARFYKSTTRMATPEVIHICDVESNEPEHAEKFREILSQMKEAKINKRIIYRLGYSNFTFELWMILHKRDCNGSLNHRSQYLKHINLAFGENFEDLSGYKQEKNFKRCLSKLTLKDVKDAVRRAEAISENNKMAGKKLVQFKGYRYFPDNPSLSIQEAVRKILEECGVLHAEKSK